MSRSLGDMLVAELGSRGQSGMYFDFAGYQELPSIHSAEDMQRFLDDNGFETVLAKDDAAWLADGLAEATEYSTPPWWASADFLGIFTMPIWLLARVPRRRRVFPRRSQTHESTTSQYAPNTDLSQVEVDAYTETT